MARSTQRHRGRRQPTRLRWLPALAAILGAFIFLAASDGGRKVRQALPLIAQLDRTAANLGFGLNKISVKGYEMTSGSDVFAALELDQVRSLIAFEAAAARARIEALPWVAQARIRRTFPHRVDIEISEREPFALWRSDDGDRLVDASGRVLAEVPRGSLDGWPVVSGAYANLHAQALLEGIRQWPDLETRFGEATLVDGRRWNLQLADGRVVLLPEAGAKHALESLVRGPRGARLLDQAATVVDLRVAGIAVLSNRSATASAVNRRKPFGPQSKG